MGGVVDGGEVHSVGRWVGQGDIGDGFRRLLGRQIVCRGGLIRRGNRYLESIQENMLIKLFIEQHAKKNQ